MDSVPALVSLKSLEGRYILMNNEYTKKFDLGQEEGERSNASDIFSKEMVELFGIHENEVIEAKKILPRNI